MNLELVTLAPRLDVTSQAFFRFRQVGKKVLITNYEGFWALLSPDEFERYATGTVQPATPLHTRLSDNNFLKATYDTRKAADRLWQRRQAEPGLLHRRPKQHTSGIRPARCFPAREQIDLSRQIFEGVDRIRIDN